MDTKPSVKWSPFHAGYFNDPYPHLADCRNYNPIQNVFENSYFFFRYEDVNAILKERDFKVHSLSDYLAEKESYIFKGVENACPFLSKATQMWPMYLNYDIHRKIRRAITKAFHALPLEALIQDSLSKTLLRFKDKSRYNLVDFCGDFIHHFITQAMDLNEDEYKRMKHFSNLLARSQDLYIPKQVYQEINAEILAMKSAFKDSLFKDAIQHETKDIGLNEEHIYSIMLISFMASFETSKDNLSLGLYEILRDKKRVEYVQQMDKSDLSILIEETFRYSNPLQYTVRINTKPMEMGGFVIPENSKLYLCIASANRDQDVFEDADDFVPDRSFNPHVAFGAGVHQCLGATIARQELEMCLQPMVDFLKDYNVGEAIWAKQVFMRTASEIMLEK